MRKKVALFILFFSFCSLFQNEEQAVVSVVDTDKGKEAIAAGVEINEEKEDCLLYTSPSPRDMTGSRMPSSA